MTYPYVTPRSGVVEYQMVSGPTHIEFTADAKGRLLRFSGARLARAEVNKNNDEITPAGIGELAATIAGNAIDIEHVDRDVCGIFTEGAAVSDPELGQVLEVGGLVHADRFPEIAAGIQDGTYSLSVEADGSKASCSICGGVFASSDLYCDHLKNKFRSGARRRVEGLTALGGGMVRRPAGNGTDFSKSIIKFVANQAEQEPDEDDLQAGWLEDELPKGQTRKDLDEGDFADPAGRRFPYKVHGKISKRGWLAAWSAAHGSHTGAADKAAIAKLKRDKPAGVDVQEALDLAKAKGADYDAAEFGSPHPMEATMKKCPYCGKELTAAVDTCPDCSKSLLAADLATDLETALANLKRLGEENTSTATQLATVTNEKTAITADLEAARVTLTAAEAKLSEARAKERRHLLGARLTDAAWETKKAVLLAMDEATFATMLELSPIAAPPPSDRKPAGLTLDGAQTPADDDNRIRIVL